MLRLEADDDSTMGWSRALEGLTSRQMLDLNDTSFFNAMATSWSRFNASTGEIDEKTGEP
jgi:hypothetical protein